MEWAAERTRRSEYDVLYVLPYCRSISRRDKPGAGWRGARWRADAAGARWHGRMDEMVPKSAMRYINGPTRLFDGLLVSGSDRTRKFLQREERSRTGHVDVRLRVAHQANRARRIETVNLVPVADSQIRNNPNKRHKCDQNQRKPGTYVSQGNRHNK